MKAWFSENISLKIIALLLALVLHLFLRGDSEEVQAVFVPVSATIPQNRVLLSESVSRIKLTVRGKRSALDRLDESGVPALRVEMADLEDGTFEFSPDLFRLPPGITVTAVQPPSMKVETDLRDQKSIQVVPRARGEVAPGYRLVGREVRPAEVTIVGPKRALKEMTAVVTEPIDVSGRTASFSTEAIINDKNSDNITFSPRRVEVDIEIEPILIRRTFADVPVELRGGNGEDAEIVPARVNVTLNGPKVLLNEMEPTDIVAIVEGLDRGPRIPLSAQRPVVLEGLPRDVTAMRIEPETVTVTLAVKDPPPVPPIEP